ncbi:hypothetical protein, partial [Frankia sp. AvcI1]
RPDNHKPINPKVVVDPFYNHTASAYLTDIVAGAVIGILFIIFTSLLIRRMDPKTVKRAPAAPVSGPPR